jgi:methionyl-tRNA synthetase
MATILYVTTEVIRQVAVLAQPFIPGSAEKLLDMLAIPSAERGFAALGSIGRLRSNLRLSWHPVALFPRFAKPAPANTTT